MATEAAQPNGKKSKEVKNKTALTPTGLLMEGVDGSLYKESDGTHSILL